MSEMWTIFYIVFVNAMFTTNVAGFKLSIYFMETWGYQTCFFVVDDDVFCFVFILMKAADLDVINSIISQTSGKALEIKGPRE